MICFPAVAASEGRQRKKMSEKSVTNEHLHDGHRARMRAKLSNHGERVFETYELFEMLLYTPIRYRDTNPVAKRLFKKYKTLDRIFRATEDELMSLPWGARTMTLEALITRQICLT